MPPLSVGLVGGGRWARTIATVLAGMLPLGSRIVWASPGNHAGIRSWIASAALPSGIAVSVHSTIDAFLSDSAVGHVCIANAAADHAATALAALNAGKNVLVEKPLALNLTDAQAIVDAAEDNKRIACVGHVLLFARYLHRFRDSISALGAMRSVHLTWHDPVAERRYNEVKSFDASITVIDDVLPHVWSVLRVLLPEGLMTLRDVAVSRGGATATVTLQGGNTACIAELVRDSDARRRILRVEAEKGAAELDFTVEPGTVTIGGNTTNADPEWLEKPRPLATELGYFLAGDIGAHPFTAREALEAVRLSDECRASG